MALICKDPCVPDEEPSEEPEPEPGGEPPSAAEDDPLHPKVLIADLLARDPNAARVLAEEFDLPCHRCPARWVETLAEGITYRGITADQVLDRLRALRPQAAAPPAETQPPETDLPQPSAEEEPEPEPPAAQESA
ncbi:MAG: hypothetical protein JKY65_19425 [Planctomycetes bacterium]|nr:hypothetical protein [Planctomycetota bacterium]